MYIINILDTHTVEELSLRWKRFIPVQINKDLEIPQITLVAIGSNVCRGSYVTGEWILSRRL